MIYAIQGPMWAGKTTELIRIAKNASSCIGIDCCNTRGTIRDLTAFSHLPSLTPFKFQPGSIDVLKNFADLAKSTEAKMVLIDEFHLAQVFKMEKEIIEIIDYAEENKIISVVTGLKFDFFNDYQQFPIWDLIDHPQLKMWKKSLLPCHHCGSSVDVVLTQCLEPEGARVGDHYVNVCPPCGIKDVKKLRDFYQTKAFRETLKP